MRFQTLREIAATPALVALLALALASLGRAEPLDTSSAEAAARGDAAMPRTPPPRLLGPLETAQPLDGGAAKPSRAANRQSPERVEVGTAFIEDAAEPAPRSSASPRGAPSRGISARRAPRTDSRVAPAIAIADAVVSDAATEPAEGTPSAAATSQIGESPAPVAALPAVPIEAARLKGIQPGTSTLAEVQMAWGMPARVQKHPDRTEHEYALPPFSRVETVFFEDVVSVIVVYLAEPVPAAEARRQLGLEDVEPAAVFSAHSELLGEVFPERGVLLSFSPGEQQHRVAQIVLEPIHPQPFALRAETRLSTHPQASLHDVDRALALDPQMTRAMWLKSQLLASTGDTDSALPLAEEAVRSEPDNIEYRLTRAKILDLDGQHSRAISETRAALNKSGLTPLVEARGLAQLADLVAAPPARDYAQGVEHRQQAIELLEPLVLDANPSLSAARQLMLELHLGMAHDIAWGDWNRKAAVVPKWLEEAESLASATSSSGIATSSQQFLIGRKALAALAGTQGDLDPTQWVKATQQAGKELFEQATDPLRKRQLQWELGMAMFDALQIYHARSQAKLALRCGELAVELLEQGAVGRPGETYAYQTGRLYFRIGAIHAVLGHDHAEAIAWFDKALPLLNEPTPHGDLGRQGESLVSMAVSYWENGDEQRGLKLTQDGLRWMEQAAKEGSLAESALSIPYANLSTMHRHLGDVESAGQFEQMAARSQNALR